MCNINGKKDVLPLAFRARGGFWFLVAVKSSEDLSFSPCAVASLSKEPIIKRDVWNNSCLHDDLSAYLQHMIVLPN